MVMVSKGTMMNEATIKKANNREIERLVFIKHLYSQASDQSNMYRPMSAASILLFHDVVELFLNLSLDHLEIFFIDNKRTTTPSFMGYFQKIGEKYPLLAADGMDKLNTVRVGLKHHGVLPDESEIKNAREAVKAFLEKNTIGIFGIDFNAISMSELIQNKSISELIRSADEHLQKDEREEALEAISKAFNQMGEVYGDNYLRPRIKSNHLDFGKYNTHDIMFAMDVVSSINNMNESMMTIFSTLIPLSLGFDFQKLQKFNNIVPLSTKDEKGNYEVIWFSNNSRPNVTKNDIKFCIDFIIECTVRMQELKE